MLPTIVGNATFSAHLPTEAQLYEVGLETNKRGEERPPLLPIAVIIAAAHCRYHRCSLSQSSPPLSLSSLPTAAIIATAHCRYHRHPLSLSPLTIIHCCCHRCPLSWSLIVCRFCRPSSLPPLPTIVVVATLLLIIWLSN